MRELRSEALFLKKQEYANSTVEAWIASTEPSKLNEKQLILIFSIGNDATNYKMELGARQENFLIKTFGPDEEKWVGNKFKMEFGSLKSYVVGGKDQVGVEVVFKK